MIPWSALKQYAEQTYLFYNELIDLVVFDENMPVDSISRCDELILDSTGNLDASLP